MNLTAIVIKTNLWNVSQYLVGSTYCAFLNKLPSRGNRLDTVWEPAETEPGHRRVVRVLKLRKAQMVEDGIDASSSCHLQTSTTHECTYIHTCVCVWGGVLQAVHLSLKDGRMMFLWPWQNIKLVHFQCTSQLKKSTALSFHKTYKVRHHLLATKYFKNHLDVFLCKSEDRMFSGQMRW